MKPLCIDLFAGLGGWAEGFLAEGWDCIGFDIERHDYGTGGYPGQLVLQDVLTLHGSQFRNAACIVASPPCQFFSYCAMPWSRAKKLAEEVRNNPARLEKELALFRACFRIQREACALTGIKCPECTALCRQDSNSFSCSKCQRLWPKGNGWERYSRNIPLIVENVKGAQPWVGLANAHYGSFYLWGDVGQVGNRVVAGKLAIGRTVAPGRAQKVNPDGTNHGTGSWFKIADSKNRGSKNNGGSWFAIGSPGQTNVGQNPDGRKLPSHISESIRNGKSPARWTNPAEHYYGHKVPGIDFSGYGEPGYKAQGFNVTAAQRYREGVKQQGSGPIWFDTGIAKHSSKSDSRKAASAQIAKIPFPLASYIARVFKPENSEAVA